jgi:hypothetical protein
VREYRIRLTIRTNENDPAGDPPYYSDQEMAGQIRRWFDDALYDRDDHPEIIWSEVVLQETLDKHTHRFKLPVKGADLCRFKGCTVTYTEERTRREAGS